MTKWRTVLLALGGAACLALIAAFFSKRPPASPPLPALVAYANLPPQFNQALAAAHAAVSQSEKVDFEAVRRLARLYHANRLFPEARACYSVLAAAPAGLTARDRYYLADIALGESDLAAAQTELKQVIALEPGYLPARLSYAESLFKSGQESAAELAYQDVIAMEAEQPDASLGLARIDLQRDAEDAAISRLEQALSRHPNAVSIAALLAKINERRGKSARAIALTQLSLQAPAPPMADPWLDALLPDCYDTQRLSLTFEEYFKTGRMDAAVPLLDRLTLLDPTGPITMMFAGVSHAKALQHITAVREYYAALRQGGDPEKICPHLVQSLLAIGNVSEAATVITGYFEKSPTSLPLAKAYAEVALRQGDEKGARNLLEKILEREPYLVPQNMALAKIQWSAGERDAAAICLQRVAVAAPADVPSRALLGEYYLGKGESLAAVKILDEAREHAAAKTPEYDHLTAMLGAACVQESEAQAAAGKLSEASRLVERAIELIPNKPEVYGLAANIYVQTKQFSRAAELLGKLAGFQPENPTIYLSLGDVLYQAGKPDQAREQWKQALQHVATGDGELRKALIDRLEGRITGETFQ